MLYMTLPTPEQPTMSIYQHPDYVNTMGERLTSEELAKRISDEGYDNWTYSDSLHLRTDGKIMRVHPFKEFIGDRETAADFLYFMREHLEELLQYTDTDAEISDVFGVLLYLHDNWPEIFTEN